HLLGRIGILDLLIAGQSVFHRLVGGLSFPVGQEVNRNEINLAAKLRIAQPDVPGFGGRHFDMPAGQFGTDAADILDQVLDRNIGAQQRFVADQHAPHVVMRRGDADEFAYLFLVAVDTSVEPGTLHHFETIATGDLRDLALAIECGVGADLPDLAGQHLHVLLDLGLTGELAGIGTLITAERRIVDAVNELAPGPRLDRPIDIGPACHIQDGDENEDDQSRIAHGYLDRKRWKDAPAAAIVWPYNPPAQVPGLCS